MPACAGRGGLALARLDDRFSAVAGRRGAIAAVVAGLLAVLNEWLNLAIANCGPGTGNGVVDGAAAFVLGMIDVAVGELALTAPGQLLGLPAWLGRFARNWLLLITGLSAGRRAARSIPMARQLQRTNFVGFPKSHSAVSRRVPR